MSLRRRAHVALYRLFLQLTPPAHRDRHGRAQVQLFGDLLATGHPPWRLWMQALPDLFGLLIAAGDRRAVTAELARVSLVPLSLAGAGVAVATAGLALATDLVPVWVAGVAAAIALQGVLGLGWSTGHLPVRTRCTARVLVGGEAMALVVGGLGLAVGVLAQRGTGDPEYGPLVLSGVVAVEAAVGLLAVPASPGGRAHRGRV